MAFRILNSQKKQNEFVQLIDVIFILLSFFLVSVGSFGFKEKLLSLPTPKNTEGRTQFLIQFVGDGRVFYLDEKAAEIVSEIRRGFGFLSPDSLNRRIINRLVAMNTMDENACMKKIRDLVNWANSNPRSRCFILIRCPDELPFDHVLNVISELRKAQLGNLEYGCVSGTMTEILHATHIEERIERDALGNPRRNLHIRLGRTQ